MNEGAAEINLDTGTTCSVLEIQKAFEAITGTNVAYQIGSRCLVISHFLLVQWTMQKNCYVRKPSYDLRIFTGMHSAGRRRPFLVMSRQFIKYGIVGGLGTAGHYLALVLGVELLAIAPIISTSFGFLVGAIINYFLNYKFTFNSKASHRKAIVRFFTIASIGFVMNIVLFNALTNNMGMNYVASQFLCTLLIMTGTFALNRNYTF